MDLPGAGRVPVMGLRQAKTGDEVRLPLPPLAAAIWHKYAGALPVTVQQYRNRHMKALMERAALTRPFVCVRYLRGEATEEVVPLWQAVNTHTARHTGADMVMLGAGATPAFTAMTRSSATAWPSWPRGPPCCPRPKRTTQRPVPDSVR
jgi:hypothetical protein